MTEDNTERSAQPSRRRPLRTRGGLGRGLGALIPDSEPTNLDTPGRPLDVFFPDLTGSTRQGEGDSGRGGSAKDLLSPLPRAKDVSRETSTSPSAEGPLVSSELNTSEQEDKGSESAPHSDSETSDVSRETSEEKSPDSLLPVPGASFGTLPPAWIIPNLKQPRQIFDDSDLRELAESITEVGVLQPIVVRRISENSLSEPGQAERLEEALVEQPDARYELVMGERRWRAAQLAGMDAIPAIVRDTGEEELLREALVENLHRVQLNPLEEAAAYAQLMEDFHYTQEELASRISKSRPQVANTLRLLKLPATVQRMVAGGEITAGHARVIVGVGTAAEMQALADRVIQEGLSVRATEEAARRGRQAAPRQPSRPPSAPPVEAQRIADAVASRLDTSVKVSANTRKGKLIIEYSSQADLNRIANILGISAEQ